MGPPSLDSLVAKIRASAARDRAVLAALANASGWPLPPSPPPPPAMRPLMLTFVAFRVGDPLGQVAALVTLAPLAGLIALGTWVVARRELHALCALIGAVLNAALCVGLKELAKEPRPAGATLQDHGMPSNHAQTTTFLCAYAIIFLWHGCSMHHAALWKPAGTALAVLLAAAVGASRVYLGEHSSAQVAVGSAVGAAVGVAWYALFCAVLRPLLLPLLEHPLARYFYLRDASRVADVMRKNYEWHRAFALTKAR